jgi:hypothetical protein
MKEGNQRRFKYTPSSMSTEESYSVHNLGKVLIASRKFKGPKSWKPKSILNEMI